jgi:hypothetical protein
LVLQSGPKDILGVLATTVLEVEPFRAYAPFAALLPYFKFILGVVIYEGVQYRLQS